MWGTPFKSTVLVWMMVILSVSATWAAPKNNSSSLLVNPPTRDRDVSLERDIGDGVTVTCEGVASMNSIVWVAYTVLSEEDVMINIGTLTDLFDDRGRTVKVPSYFRHRRVLIGGTRESQREVIGGVKTTIAIGYYISGKYEPSPKYARVSLNINNKHVIFRDVPSRPVSELDLDVEEWIWGRISEGEVHITGMRGGRVVATGRNSEAQCNVSGWTDIVAIAAGYRHTLGLQPNGTVVVVGRNDDGQCNVSGWTDIVALAAGWNHTVGLRSDGMVVAVGRNNYGQCNVSGWADIVAVAAEYDHSVGLRSDGTVVAAGQNNYGQCSVSEWTDIVAIATAYGHTLGLRSDGTLVAVGSNDVGQSDVSQWTDIVAVTAGGGHTVALRSDGTVVAVGLNNYGQCNVSGWTNIIALVAGELHTVGLRSDGTVVTAGRNNAGQSDVSGWTDIVALSAGELHTVGLRSSGTGKNAQ